MAQKISIQLIDDIDGSEATESVSFALDGQSYVIDLSDKNAQALRDALAPYVAHAQRATSGRGRGRSRGGSTASDIRAWARSAGYTVPDRGRVSAEIKAAYDAAH
ncbi:MAG: histone-like nucleoid-structuring protein Lsr2 [Marmoricola sp.]